MVKKDKIMHAFLLLQGRSNIVSKRKCRLEANSELCQASNMEFFARTING